jgi:hypothetical protein
MINKLIALKAASLLEENHLNRLTTLLKSLGSITGNFQNNNCIKPYNIILAASDIYYRENYHSDIMAYILENKKNTMRYFIDYINTLSDDLPTVSINDFLNTEVVREKNKIDILIKDLSSYHCIIIENKINNAGDMKRQLPRYYNVVVKNGYKVDRIIYYSLDGEKCPDKSTWTNEDLQLGLDKKIVFGAGANGSENDFVNAFLVPCKNNTENEQEKAFYCQYIDLLEYMRRNQMNYQLMEKFYHEMINIEQYNSALSIRDMLNDFPTFRRDRIYDHFLNNYAPFEKTFKWSSNDTVYEYIRDIEPNENIKIDVFSEQNQSKICFWIQEPKIKSDLIKTILEKIGEENSFIKKDINFYIKIFKFPEEDEMMYKYLEKLFVLLEKNKYA